MATVLEKLQTAMLDPGWSRRRFLGRVVRGSAAVAAAAAGVATTGTTVAQAFYSYGCCNLVYGPPFCPNNSCGSCSGSTDYRWYCTDSISCYTMACGECYTCGCSYAYRVCRCC